MKTLISVIALATGLLALPLSAMENLELEPCINGSVSSSGMYATQALEDAANVRLAEQHRNSK